jgi:integrase
MARRTDFDDPWTVEGKLTDGLVAALTPPPKGNRLRPHGGVSGLNLRVTAGGAKAWVLRYRNRGGRERAFTIGDPADGWTVAKAVDQAKSLRRRVDAGEDPMAEREAERRAQTVTELWAEFEQELLPSRRPSTAAEYRRQWQRELQPHLGRLKIAAVTKQDVEALHRKIAKDHSYQANRVLALASVLFALAVERKLRPDNPAAGIKKAPEERRERFLTSTELGRLNDVLAAHPERTSAAAIRLMLLTGCRRGEALAARWSEFDLDAGTWLKPSSNTKQKKPHKVPLGSDAVELVRQVQAENRNSPHVFTSNKKPGERLTSVKRVWVSACKSAGLRGVRLHDLRHSFASALVSGGLNLPVIGQLLGHNQPRTTSRYAHLYDAVLREAAEHVGRIANSRPDAEIVPPRRA